MQPEKIDDVNPVDKEVSEIIFYRTYENIKVPEKQTYNYCAIYGTLPNELVDAKSNLAVELI